MINSPRSCGVASPCQRNCATSDNGATPTATHYLQIAQKPASIRELRTQLVAQLQRNKAATIQVSTPPKVAHEITPVAHLQPLDNKASQFATHLVKDFMDVDGLSLEEAEALAAVSVAPRPPVEWLALIQELDGLIDRYCQVCRLSDAARARIREVRKHQGLASIPLAVDWFRRELSAHDKEAASE